MKEIEFNLLTEPWIRVRLRDNTVREVSLTEALVSAQDYANLAGEMPTQNAAVLLLLLAVLFTVFARVDTKGESRPLMQSDDALEMCIRDSFYTLHPTKDPAPYGTAFHHRIWSAAGPGRCTGGGADHAGLRGRKPVSYTHLTVLTYPDSTHARITHKFHGTVGHPCTRPQQQHRDASRRDLNDPCLLYTSPPRATASSS